MENSPTPNPMPSEPAAPVASTTSEEKTPMMKTVAAVIVIVIAIVLIFAAFSLITNRQMPSTENNEQETEDTSTTNEPLENPTAEWQTYTGDGFTFKYPSTMTMNTTGVGKNVTVGSTLVCNDTTDCAQISGSYLVGADPMLTSMEAAQNAYTVATFEDTQVGENLRGVKVIENGVALGSIGNLSGYVFRTSDDRFLLFSIDSANLTVDQALFEEIAATLKLNVN